ncbi:MAG: hypothetical protein NZT92_01355 [Abditibacteriales bacterium]|nr:hypothetical protein [Abditibacteriales bacterium]MDW8364396.1 hypothetical protein [Abditibacteriales bacterium]
MEFWKYYRILKRRLGLFAGVAVIVFTVVAISRSLQGGGVNYTAVLRIFTTPPAGIQQEFLPDSASNNLGTLLTLASSQPVLQAVIRKLELKTTVQELERQVSITQEGGTGILNVRVTATDQREAKVLAQTLGEEFLAYIDELNKQEVKTTRTFIEEQFDQAKKDLLDVRRRLYEYQTGPMHIMAAGGGGVSVNVASPVPVYGTGRGPIPPGILNWNDLSSEKSNLTRQLNRRISEVTQQKHALEQRLASVKAQLADLGSQLAKTPKTIPVQVIQKVRPEIEALRRQRDNQRMELAQLQVTKTEEHPDVKRAKAYLEKLEKRLKEEESKPGMEVAQTIEGPNQTYELLVQKVTDLQAQQKSLVAEINKVTAHLKELLKFQPRAPIEEIKLNSLLLEAHAREQTYLSLARQVDDIRVQEKMQNKLGTLTLMGAPLVYGGPLQSVIKNLVLALMMALGAALATVIALDYLDNRVKTPQDVETLLQLPILGIIPASETYPASWRRSQGWSVQVAEWRDRIMRGLPGGRDDRE